MTRILAVGLLVSLSCVATTQATRQSADPAAADRYCRPKASTPETPAPDPRFDVAAGSKPADTAPVLSRSTPVRYPKAAMDAGICGTVVLQVLVKADGKVGGARVIESLDKVNGLDADALKTVTSWRFKPGLLDGKTVATVIKVRVEYVLDALPVDPFQAGDNIGRFAKICGYLRPAAASNAEPGMHRFDFSSDKKSLMVRIPEAAKDVLDRALLPQSVVCVIGRIDKAAGRTQMTVMDGDRIIKDPTGVELADFAKYSDPGIIKPKILAQFDPKYTPEAMRRSITGLVEMDAIVMTDGSVGYIRVARSLDAVYGLDNEAVATLRRWRFEPGTNDGRPIPVLVRIQMEFRLH